MADRHGVRAAWPAKRGTTVRCLAAVADQGIAMQAEADAAIRSCGIAGVVPSTVAGRLGEVLHGYSRLRDEVEALDTGTDPELSEVRRNLLDLLSYHLHMLRDAGDLVFSGRDVPRNERFRLELAGGLGSRAAELTGLREQLTVLQHEPANE